MLYKFQSPATGDVIMLGPHGDWMLRLLGREPALRGIIEPQDMAAALTALRHAVEQDDQIRADDGRTSQVERGPSLDRESRPGDHPQADEAVSARRRLWPMIDMLQRAQAAREPIVWGV
jgi:hypothetical protein